MTKAISGTFADFKLVKTRSVAQIIVEVPIERAGEIIQQLGIPQPGKEKWVALVLLQETKVTSEDKAPTDKPKRSWDDIPPQSQVAMKCGDIDFRVWAFRTLPSYGLAELENPALEIEQRIKKYCMVKRKRDLETNAIARGKWNYLVTQFSEDTRETAEIRG